MESSSLPRTQTAAVLHGPYGGRHIVDHQYLVAAPGLHDVVVKLEASGICAGDIHPRDGGLLAPPTATRPLIAGHEGIGHIAAVGKQVQQFTMGQRVGLGWRRSTCHECAQCEGNQENYCENQAVNGYESNGAFQGNPAESRLAKSLRSLTATSRVHNVTCIRPCPRSEEQSKRGRACATYLLWGYCTCCCTYCKCACRTVDMCNGSSRRGRLPRSRVRTALWMQGPCGRCT